MEGINVKSTTLQLVLANEVLDLLQHARSNATLHINALDARGNPIKMLCSLEENGQVSLDLEGGGTNSMFQLSDGDVTSCVVKSVVHPVYMVMHNSSPPIDLNSMLSAEMSMPPVDLAGSLPGELSLSATRDIDQITCDLPLSEADQLSTDNVVMHLDDIGASNIVLQYSDIVEEAGEMVLTSLTDHCYEISGISNHNIATVLYDEGST